jgi:hypothetical protein
MINIWSTKRVWKRAEMAALAAVLFCPAFSFSEVSPVGPETFSTAKAAADALVTASETNDTPALLRLFAPNGKDLIDSGDPAEDAQSRSRFTALAHKKMALLPDPADPSRLFISIGDEDWPFPVPLIQKDGRWMFDSSEGQKEVRARYIGVHELTAAEICRGYVEAQNQYAQTHLHGGIPEYAQNITSSPGRQDGLYWESKKDELPPPVPADFAKAARRTDQGRPYHGYFFRILTAQGPDAHGGAMNYIREGAMTAGFALVAWPAHYGETGVQTLIVNQDGVIYQSDLGAGTEKTASALTRFNPDNSWTEVKTEK